MSDSDPFPEFEMRGVRFTPSTRGGEEEGRQTPPPSTTPTTKTTVVDEAQECLAQSLLMFLYADLRLLSATGRINTKFETLCIDSDRVPRTSAAELAQLANNNQSSVNDYFGEGVSPAQIMAILIVELRQEVIAQRQRAKEQLRKAAAGGWVHNLTADEDDDEGDSDEDDDAGVLNKITDRKGRKEFETDMHGMIRSYNGMLAQDLKGIPEVKMEKTLEKTLMNPLRRATQHRLSRSRQQRSAWRTGLTQRLFSFDDMDHNNNSTMDDQTGQEPYDDDDDDDSSKKSASSATKKLRIAARFTGALMRKQQQEPRDITIESKQPSEGDVRSEVLLSSNSKSRLSLIEEAEEGAEDSERDTHTEERTEQVSESEKGPEGEHDPRPPTTSKVLNQSKLFEIIESLRGSRAAQSPDDSDLHSLKSDPGPNQSWRADDDRNASNISNTRPKMERRTSTFVKLTNKLERYREDHALHNKYIIPTDDYETFAGAEEVGNKLLNTPMTTSMRASMAAMPELAQSVADPERNLSEKELLDFMTKCIESRNVDSLDFMADFFRDNTISQTMVKSKARVVWLQDWYPIKDCIYAISVDEEKKRVLVVFRGATTRADWNHGFDAAMKKGHNPVKDDYEGKKSYLKIHRGFYTYLFRTRKDTSTRKYDEIANKVYEYGTKIIGENDFTVTVNGYSLGGALSVLFGFYASTDDRFTRNGPVKIFSYGSPYVVGHSFADAFRHQERKKKVQHARFYNNNDIVAHMPFNATPTKRGSNFVHIGIDVKLYSVPGMASLWGNRPPRIRYNDRQPPLDAYWRALKMNSLLNMPLPWLIKDKHGLPELQKRVARATKMEKTVALMEKESRSTTETFLRSTLDEVYELMVYQKD